jgi:hypothetical protein
LSRVKKRWPGPRIVFNFLDCPSCKKRLDAPNCKPLVDEIAEVSIIEEDVHKKAMERAKFENLDKDPRVKDPADRFYNNLRDYAIYKLSYY